ncbi:TIGR01212 family radical SAM protein [Peptoniphilus sp. KCTC 25270]|uniref:TIGR01212 family radical SAM protein n=1 Tax=Peptoniphilus sp. KCTC 25270 TaxID=2897414 RepID=UPI001E2CC427|nr:TIGR01212 family radical SAM protein [Peptoniphilus sp. KCTC 25270]MCD1146650.1 TIGR01212 family radical SAM protein [Peptoniphilus sp. KCTC 25270]
MEYLSANQYIKKRFGEKAYKISLDGGFTCPTRDGTKGTRGCIFCSQYGSGDYAQSKAKSITEQIEEGKKLVQRKNKKENTKYIAYFQAYTNTYAPMEKLESLFTEAINHPDVIALSIATRPDCLEEDILPLLEKLNKIKPLWIELGLQTIHEKSAKYIRRGYSLKTYDEAVEKLRNIGIEQIITHVILGLPGETKKQMLETVDYVGKSKSNGIKLQLLHVLENTDLAKEYRKGTFEVLELEEYAEIVAESIGILPEDMVIHRITGDGNRHELIAPKWSLKKWHTLQTIQKKIQETKR